MSHTTRAVTLAQRGMVASPHYLASLAGLDTLREGGSAVDAAISVNSTLGVVYSHMTGVGGDAIWLIYDAASGSVHALNGSGRAGANATRDLFASQGHTTIPVRGPKAAITVPGTVDSWCAAHNWFGTLPLAHTLRTAINYARGGHAVCAGKARCLNEVSDVLRRYSSSRETLFTSGGQPPKPGDVVRFPKLAETLETIAQQGRDGFYTGAVAEEIVGSLQKAGGLLTMEDLAAHRSEWEQPLSTTYRGFECFQHPPNSQGFVHLMMLNILEGFDLSQMGQTSADYLHTVTEATKLAFADRDRYLTDPDFTDIPLDTLLSKQYAAELRDRIRPDLARQPGQPSTLAGDTTCSVVVDSAGNAVSVIQSLYHEVGSGFVAGDTGVLLQNRGSFFSLDEEHVNTLEPGKRTFHTLMPGMLLRNGQPYLVYGTMGGEGQPQTSTALVNRIVDYGDEVQQAIDRPRWLHGRTWGEQSEDLRVESRIPESVRSGLQRRGHTVHTVDEFDDIMGHAQAIHVDSSRGVLMGGADPRGEGLALGW
ncbi:gamma-glutamyltransferase [Nocardiopsis oceani]